MASLFQRVTSNAGATEHRHRIWGPHREVAQVVVREEGGEVSRSTVYLHADALGTTEVLTDEGGEVIHRQATDAFGKGEEPVGGGSGVLTSFTGHQHDLELGVVDMRGRLYDASVGRFLTPDPVIQAPFYSQGLNAYSYVFNSPTNFIDPLGLQAQSAGSRVCSEVWGAGLDSSGKPYKVTVEIGGCAPPPQSAPQSAPTKAAPATGTEAALAGAAGLGVGLGVGIGASYATGAFASLACGPGAPLCAGAVTLGITLSLAGAAIYSLWNGGAEEIAGSASRLASGEGTVDDYFLGGSLVGGLASGPLAPRFNASGANPGLRLRQLFTGSAGEGAALKCPGCSICFAPGTEVVMADGSTKAIEDVAVGDLVLSDDPTDEAPPEAQEVEELHRTSTHRLFHIHVGSEDGGEVLSTGRHPFWTQRGWVAAEDLDASDLLLDSAGKLTAIRSISVESRETPTFNLSVKKHHTYFVVAGMTPLLVHNVDPWDVLYTQPTYGATFAEGPHAGRSLIQVAAEARALGRLPDGLTLNATRMADGRWATLNNRTLAVARMANLPNVNPVDAGDKGFNIFQRLLRDGGLSGPVEDAVMRCR
ncbi:polymorphic toxin-type HINT domain-containing protein [Sorangium sp. So ce296]|uniref:polymorphic toxin-type HINT domain-containing protein n=1 Tax=Sorangium sp. So ce296 TaxID=3133296 RepID=UPI003F62CE52